MTELIALQHDIYRSIVICVSFCSVACLSIGFGYWLLDRARTRRIRAREAEIAARWKIKVNEIVESRITTGKASDLPTDDQWFDALSAGRFQSKHGGNHNATH